MTTFIYNGGELATQAF